MEKIYIKKIEDIEYISYLLKYLKGRSGDLTGSYDNEIVKSVYNPDYTVTGIYYKRKCKTCQTNWEIIQIGLIYVKNNKKIKDMIDFSVDVKYRDDEEIKELVRDYLKQWEEVSIHSTIYDKEYWEEYLNTKLIEYSTFIMENNSE